MKQFVLFMYNYCNLKKQIKNGLHKRNQKLRNYCKAIYPWRHRDQACKDQPSRRRSTRMVRVLQQQHWHSKLTRLLRSTTRHLSRMRSSNQRSKTVLIKTEEAQSLLLINLNKFKYYDRTRNKLLLRWSNSKTRLN